MAQINPSRLPSGASHVPEGIGERFDTLRNTKLKQNMRILHTITCTKFQAVYGAHEEFTRHLTRPKKLTHAGIQRMMARGCDEYVADPAVTVVRVETAVYAK